MVNTRASCARYVAFKKRKGTRTVAEATNWQTPKRKYASTFIPLVSGENRNISGPEFHRSEVSNPRTSRELLAEEGLRDDSARERLRFWISRAVGAKIGDDYVSFAIDIK